jgi:hypothetical protein
VVSQRIRFSVRSSPLFLRLNTRLGILFNRLSSNFKCNTASLSGYTQRELNALAHRLNSRPRECLGFATPLEGNAQLRHHSPVALGT